MKNNYFFQSVAQYLSYFKLELDPFGIYDYLSAVKIRDVDVNAMTAVKGGTWWVRIFSRIIPSTQLSRTGPRIRCLVVLLKQCSDMVAHQGIRGLVIHLKACSVCLAQALGGHMIKDTAGLNTRVSRTNRGLPRFILAVHRAQIRSGDHREVQFYLTFFAIFRVLSFEGVPKLKSITAPFSGNLTEMVKLYEYIPDFVKALGQFKNSPVQTPLAVTWVGIQKVFSPASIPNIGCRLFEMYKDLPSIWLAKSAPGTHAESPVSVTGHPLLMIRSITTMLHDPSLSGPLKYFGSLLGMGSPAYRAYTACVQASHLMRPLPTFGKLGFKPEAAGKVRVFAMVPLWVNILLNPLHLVLQDVLRSISIVDGTFNQLGPLQRFLGKRRECYSLDLSSATDRLPLLLQEQILAVLIGSKAYARNWAQLLTKGSYLAKSMEYGINQIIHYAVGQPMGALSSWVMLAITHHFMVQVAAWRSGVTPRGTWFMDYAVLGDDLVIFNKQVAKEYLRICKILGVEIGLHKSVLANNAGVFEFAKQIFFNGRNVSPVPIPEFFASLRGYGALFQFRDKYSIPTSQILNMLGIGYQARCKFGGAFAKMPLILKKFQIASSLPATPNDVADFLMQGAPTKAKWSLPLSEFFSIFAISEQKSLLAMITKQVTVALNDPKQFWALGERIVPLMEHSRTAEFFKGEVNRFALMAKNWVTPAEGIQTVMFKSDFGYNGLVLTSPAEYKERGKGFILIPPFTGMLVPVHVPKLVQNPETGAWVRVNPKLAEIVGKISPSDYTPYPLTEESMLLIKGAFGALFDWIVLPQREQIQRIHDEILPLISSFAPDPDRLGQVFIDYLELASATTRLPTSVAPLERSSSDPHRVDPIIAKLWRRWGPIIQGAVYVPRNLVARRLLGEKA